MTIFTGKRIFGLEAISLGAGVQSSTMALMASAGEYGVKPDMAIFADTGGEPKAVYSWLDWLETQLSFPVYRVRVRNKSTLPQEAVKVRKSRKTGKLYIQQDIPAFTVEPSGKKGIMWRQCTERWKIRPINQFLLKFKAAGVGVWLGISTDEAHRMKPSQRPWIMNRYPLIDSGMSRTDCLTWMKSKGYPEPPRSACIFCPYHSDAEWIRLHDEDQTEFVEAVKFERQLNESVLATNRLRTKMYLHSSRVPA